MSFNLAQALGGPAFIVYKGQAFYSKADIRQDFALDTFDIATSAFGPQTDIRKREQPIRLRFVPAGEWEALAILFPYAATVLGKFITPVLSISAVNTGAGQVTIANHGLVTGSAVRPFSTGTLIGGLAQNGLYYVRAVDVNTLSFFLTYANAVAGTSMVALTTSGTGPQTIVQNEPLYIYPIDGSTGVVFWNAAIFHQPDIIGTAVGTLLGEVVFSCYPINGQSWAQANSIYTESQANPGDSTFAPANVLTQPYTLQWGGLAPWNSFLTKSGFTMAFQEEMTPYDTDSDGILTHRLSGINASLKCTPLGISSDALKTALGLQGPGASPPAVRGATLQGNDLYVFGTGVDLRLTAAALIGGPAMWSAVVDRVGDLEWRACRKFSAGVAQPLYYVGSTSVT